MSGIYFNYLLRVIGIVTSVKYGYELIKHKEGSKFIDYFILFLIIMTEFN